MYKQNNWNLQTFTHLLEYKCKLKGNQVIKVNEACVDIKIKNSEAKKLYHIVEKIYKNKEKIKSNGEIKDIIDNL